MLTVSPRTNNNTIKINDGTFTRYNWTITGGVTYNDVINYERAGKKQVRHCVMCGIVEDGKNCKIPNQNKDVCRVCDSTYWFLNEMNVLVKFCKGCKTFFPLMNYDDKPEASKCGSCRRRGRDNYYFKKAKDAKTVTPVKIKEDEKYVQSMKKMRSKSLSPEEFCTMVNTLAPSGDEGIDIHTLLEFASNDFPHVLEGYNDTHEPVFIRSSEHSFMSLDENEDEFAKIWDNDNDDDEDDEMMDEMFLSLPELVISPPMSPAISI
jgi:hypothetical protein